MTALAAEDFREARRRCWSPDEFHRMAQSGIFGSEEHRELIYDEIIARGVCVRVAVSTAARVK